VAEPVPSRVALVTGAGSGIGRALAVGLAEHGLDVGLLGRHAQPLEQTARQCRDAGAEVAVVVADVTDASVTVAVAEVAERLGPIDLLVNNAGRIDATEVPFVAADLDDVLGVVEVTLLGVLRVTHAVLGRMVEQGRGRILTVNSGFADARSPAYTGYAVAKAAAARLTDLVAAQSGGGRHRHVGCQPWAGANSDDRGHADVAAARRRALRRPRRDRRCGLRVRRRRPRRAVRPFRARHQGRGGRPGRARRGDRGVGRAAAAAAGPATAATTR
jgi:NADP-dependent 3-hydroxy acid dehydrogenase YdfG